MTFICHPSIVFSLFGAGSQGQLSEQGHPDFLVPGHFLWLFREDPKGAARHPAEETHFGRLYPGSYSFGHDPKFMAIGEGWNVD